MGEKYKIKIINYVISSKNNGKFASYEKMEF